MSISISGSSRPTCRLRSDIREPVYVSDRRTNAGLDLDLTGEWRANRLAELDRELSRVELSGVREVSISTAGVTALDLSATWRLREFIEQAQRAGAQVAFREPPPDTLRLIDDALMESCPTRPKPEHFDLSVLEEPVEALGRTTVRAFRNMVSGLAFTGRLVTALVKAIVRPRGLRPISIARHIYDTGITAIPIVSLIAFLISVIIAYMSAQQLLSFGAEIFVVDLVTIGTLRELGVLLTAIIVAGRSGSAFAAEIGAMRLNEEVDALKAIGVNHYEALVVPRVLGLVIALPLLTVISDAVGLTGGALLCRYLLDIPLSQYVTRVNDAIAPTTFWVGLIKAPIFAVLIGLAGTFRGMQVRDSSRELGRLTTVAVVQAIFLVILADALFAVLFMELGI
jgi:phospholipid/cholesterol/gamma-HCH transport system permease protein